MAKKTKSNKILTVVIILGLLVIGASFYYGGFSNLLAIFGLTNPNLCSQAPQNWDCVCPEGQEKVEVGVYDSSYECREPIQYPPVEFPIETWGEARAYANEQGLTQCPTGFYRPDFPFDQVLEGDYGVVDCIVKNGAFSGDLIWTTAFRLDNGDIIKRNCNTALMGTCPDDVQSGLQEEAPDLDFSGYSCNTNELDSYVKTLNGKPITEIIDTLKQACEDHKGTPIANNPPFGNNVHFSSGYHNEICYNNNGGSFYCGSTIYDYATTKCILDYDGISGGATLWSVRIYPEDGGSIHGSGFMNRDANNLAGTVDSNGKKCSDSTQCNPADPIYHTINLFEVGLCFAQVGA